VDAQWREPEHCWRLRTTGGELSADVIVAGMGGLSAPAIPDIPGLDEFEGTLFHSADWDHDHDLRGERVGVIGTGASAVQFIPEVQPRAGSLHLFQRTPAWVMPDPDRAVSDRERRVFRGGPAAQRAARGGLYTR